MEKMKKTETISKNRTEQGHIMALLQSLQAGQSFYTIAPAKVATRYAAMYGKQIKTERVLSIHSYSSSNPQTSKLTKVTIL